MVFVAGAAYSSFLALREAPVGPPGHGAELRAFLPILHGKQVLYAGQDRYAAYELLGADTHVPLVEFPDPEVAANPEKPFDTGDAYSPIDFDSFSRGDPRPLPLRDHRPGGVEQPGAAQLPPHRRHALLPALGADRPDAARPPRAAGGDRGGGRCANCAAPEIRILLSNPGRAALFPGNPVIGPKGRWDAGGVLGTGERTSQTLSAAGGALAALAAVLLPLRLTLTAPGLREPLKAALDGQRPSAISLANDGQFWPAGEIVSWRRRGPLHDRRRRSRPPCSDSAATKARPTSASWSRSPPGRTGSCRFARHAAAGSTGTNPLKRLTGHTAPSCKVRRPWLSCLR